MNAIRIIKTINSDVLHLPELRPLIGHEIEIILLDKVRPDATANSEFWNIHTVDQLAAEQGVAPAQDVEKLYGTFTDAEFEGFEGAVEAWRSSTRSDLSENE